MDKSWKTTDPWPWHAMWWRPLRDWYSPTATHWSKHSWTFFRLSTRQSKSEKCHYLLAKPGQCWEQSGVHFLWVLWCFYCTNVCVRQAQGHADEHLTFILDDGLPKLQATVCKTKELSVRSLGHGKSISPSSWSLCVSTGFLSTSPYHL